jgi:hypothetical protein
MGIAGWITIHYYGWTGVVIFFIGVVIGMINLLVINFEYEQKRKAVRC